MKTHKLGYLLLFITLFATITYALPLTVEHVKLDSQELSTNAVNRLDVERGKEVEVEIRFSSSQPVRNVEVEAFIAGYEFNDVERISDTTPPFDMDPNVSYVKKLSLTIPDEVDEDNYKLRLIVSNRDSELLVSNYGLKIDVPRHALTIRDVLLSPGPAVKAGSAVLATIRLENKGEKDQEDVKVTFSIPELGLETSDFIDKVKNDDEEETEELLLRLPNCAKSGAYTAHVIVQFQRGHRTLTQQIPLTILENEQCTRDTAQAQISIGRNTESLPPGGLVVFPLTIANTGSSSKSFSITAEHQNLGTVQVFPSHTLVLGKGESQHVQVSVQTNKDVSPGTHPLSLTVSSLGKPVAIIPLSLQITTPNNSSLRQVLEFTVLALLVLLAIIGLVVAALRLFSA